MAHSRKTVKIREFINDPSTGLCLKVLSGNAGLKKEVHVAEINRPQLALSGSYNDFPFERTQIVGNSEINYMVDLDPDELETRLDRIFAFDIPCLIVTNGLRPLEVVEKVSEKYDTPVLLTDSQTGEVISNYVVYMSEKLSPHTTIHGVVVDVFGVGILILGKPGVGKSEAALELIERGHRLVTDDVVEVRCRGGSSLYAHSSEVIGHHMELRGIGIIDVRSIFGAGAIREHKRINLVVELEAWDETKQYDRTGLSNDTFKLLGVTLTKLILPVSPGRNLSILIEVAARNHRLKESGTHTAALFNQRLLEQMSRAVHPTL